MKDTLGDSGMLLDTDMTMTNSPDASPSQVHNIIKRVDNKVIMRENNGNVQQQQPQYYYNQFYSQEAFKTTRSLGVMHQSCAIPFNIPVDTNRLVNHKIQKTLPNIIHHQNIERDAFGVKENIIAKGHPPQFNHYADENDSTTKFQLSKSASNRCHASSVQSDTSTVNNLNRMRLFGNDRTNLMQVDRLQFCNRPSNVINLRKENFHTFNISNNMILRNSNTAGSRMLDPSQNSQFIQDNPVMFRNYDLNDEYWLNFE